VGTLSSYRLSAAVSELSPEDGQIASMRVAERKAQTVVCAYALLKS